MSQCDLIAAKPNSFIVERTTAHMGAKTAWIGFLPDIENNLADLRINNMVFGIVFLTELTHTAVVASLTVKSGIKCQSYNGIVDTYEASEPNQTV